ncbi:MAG: hypothetical protein WC783_04255 [Candidatus Paceibacterota bacterium]
MEQKDAKKGTIINIEDEHARQLMESYWENINAANLMMMEGAKLKLLYQQRLWDHIYSLYPFLKDNNGDGLKYISTLHTKGTDSYYMKKSFAIEINDITCDFDDPPDAMPDFDIKNITKEGE